MKTLLSILALSIALAHSPAANADAAAYDRTLDTLDAMVKDYERVAAKSPLCLTDVNSINVNLIPRLTQMNSDTQTLQASGYQPGPVQLQRYLDITGRMQKAMMQFGTRMKDAKMDC